MKYSGIICRLVLAAVLLGPGGKDVRAQTPPTRDELINDALDKFESAGGRAEYRTNELLQTAWPGYMDEPQDRYVTYEEAAEEPKYKNTEDWLQHEYPYFYRDHMDKKSKDRGYAALHEEYNELYDDGSASYVPPFLKYLDFGVTVESGRKATYYMDAVLPLIQTDTKEHTIFNQDHIAVVSNEDRNYSVGFGYRYFAQAYPYIAGVNLFYDWQENFNHYRFGYGAEFFTDLVEARFNYYNAMSQARQIDLVDLGGGFRIIEYEQAVDGFDLELGTGIPYVPMAKMFAGYERYDHQHSDDAVAWTTRLELRPVALATVNLEYINPNRGDGRFRFDGRMSFPFSSFDPKDIVEDFKEDYGRPGQRRLVDRLTDRVERTNKIAVERWTESGLNIVPLPVGSGGDIQIQLIWSTDSDMDLHILLPAGDPSHVYFGDLQSFIGSDLFAELDVDDIPLSGGHDSHPGRPHVENIFVVDGMAVAGNYNIFVHAWDLHGSTPVTVNVFVGGEYVSTYNHTFTADDEEFHLPALVYP